MEFVNESRLAVAARDGDPDAFGRLVMSYATIARRVAYVVVRNWEDAEDVVQDAALSSWRAIERYDPTRSFRPWFLRIVANAALDHRRRQRVRKSEPLPDDLRTTENTPEVATDRALIRARIDKAMVELPEKQRIAVTLFDAEGYSHSEIAGILSVPEGTVRSYVFHARRALRRALAAQMVEPA